MDRTPAKLLEYSKKYREETVKVKKFLVDTAKDMFENKFKNGIEIKEELAKALQNKMIKFIECEQRFFTFEMPTYNSCIAEFRQTVDKDHEMAEKKKDMKKYIENVGVGKWIDTNLAASAQQQLDPKDDPYYKMLVDFLFDIHDSANQSQDDDDGLEVIEQEFQIPIDPFSRQPIKVPFRNPRCIHVFEKASFLSAIEGKSTIKCPTAGCAIKDLSLDQMYEDLKLQLMIEWEAEKIHAEQ